MAKQSLSARAKHDPKLLAKVLANPGLRSKLPVSMLPANLRAKRTLNDRLSAPVVPGSSMTYGDAARQANAQTTVKYGQAEQALGTELGQAQGYARDVPDWYQQYQDDLKQHAANVGTIGGQATTALANQAQGIRGLDQATLAAQQGAADTEAAKRGATAGNLGPTASDASTVRQAMLAALAGGQTGANTANATYADTVARVVAPGQKLQARAQAAGKVAEVKGKQTQLASEKGAFNLGTRQQIAADEAKNVLAGQALTGKTAAQQTQDAIDAARLGETTRHNKASEANTAAGRRATAAEKAAAGDHYGYTNAEWKTMNPAQRRDAAKKWKQSTSAPTKPGDPATKYAKDFYAKYGVKPAATAAVGNAKNSISTASSYVNDLKKAGWTRQQIGQALLQGVTADKKKNQKGYPKQKALWLTVALDLAWLNGRVSAGTAKRLHSAGYSVKTLGLNTGGPTVVGPKDLPSGGPTNPK